jgi:hypothetical protein
MSADPAIRALVTDHVVAAVLQLARFEGVAGQGPWSASLDEGTLTTGGRTFAVELLGTHSAADGSFLWGWDHPSAPPGRTALAERVRDEAAHRGVRALQDPNPSDEVVHVMTAAILGVGLAGGDAWWLVPDDPTTVVLLVRDDALAAEPYDLIPLPRVLGVAEAVDADLRRVFDAYLEAPLPGVPAEADGPDAYVLRTEQGTARVELDGDLLGRVTLELAADPGAAARAEQPKGLGRLLRRPRRP